MPAKFDSKQYWENRYALGGNSGAGSEGTLAEFKAETINRFIRENNINSLADIGCGDGNQAKKIVVPFYLGVDVSPTAVEQCKKIFANSSRHRFKSMDLFAASEDTAQMTLSMDVIFHLPEQEIYSQYMALLFDRAEKYCVIYSSNKADLDTQAEHVYGRVFSEWISQNRPQWSLLHKLSNPYSFDKMKSSKLSSFSDFYFFSRN